MIPITKLTDDFSVAPQLNPADIKEVAEAGFRSILILRPDEEVMLALSSTPISDVAREHGLATFYLPVYALGDKPFPTPEAFKATIEALPRPILAYCRTGMRAVRLYYRSFQQ